MSGNDIEEIKVYWHEDPRDRDNAFWAWAIKYAPSHYPTKDDGFLHMARNLGSTENPLSILFDFICHTFPRGSLPTGVGQVLQYGGSGAVWTRR